MFLEILRKVRKVFSESESSSHPPFMWCRSPFQNNQLEPEVKKYWKLFFELKDISIKRNPPLKMYSLISIQITLQTYKLRSKYEGSLIQKMRKTPWKLIKIRNFQMIWFYRNIYISLWYMFWKPVFNWGIELGGGGGLKMFTSCYGDLFAAK